MSRANLQPLANAAVSIAKNGEATGATARVTSLLAVSASALSPYQMEMSLTRANVVTALLIQPAGSFCSSSRLSDPCGGQDYWRSQPRFHQKKRLFRSSDDMAISFARRYVSSYYLLVEVEAAELARELDAKAGKGG